MIRNIYQRKLFTSIALLLVLAMSLVACSGGSTPNASSESDDTSPSASSGEVKDAVYPENGLPKNEEVTLKVGFFLAGMGQEYFDYAVSTFQEKFPNVKFDILSSPTISDIIGTKISADDDEEMFDLFNGNPPGGRNALASLVEAGKLESMEDVWDQKLYDNDLTVREALQEGSYDIAQKLLGKSYSIPLFGNGAGLFYNKALFEKHGWNENPKTWDEFLNMLENIKAAGIIPITFPGQHAYYLDYSFGSSKLFELADLNGNLDEFTEDYRNFKLPQFLAPENVERMNRIYELGQNGYFPKGVAALNHTQSQMQVLQGEAALVSTGVWVENEMKEATPEDFVWGFMAVPFGSQPDDAKYIHHNPQSTFHLWANKPDLNKQWAKQFIIWMLNMDVQEYIGEKAGQLPIRQDFLDDAVRIDKLPQAAKSMFQYIASNNVKTENGNRDITLTDPSYAQATKIMSEAMMEVVEGKQDPLPVLSEVEQLLKQAVEAQK